MFSSFKLAKQIIFYLYHCPLTSLIFSLHTLLVFSPFFLKVSHSYHRLGLSLCVSPTYYHFKNKTSGTWMFDL